MSTLALTATYTVTAVIGMAAMYVPARLARYDARAYNALAEQRLTACEARDAAFEETRNKPWYWPTGPHVTGELLAVEHHDVPAIAAEPHHDDEDAPAEDTDRPFLAQLIAVVTIFGWGFILRSWWRSLPWVERWEDFRQTRRERDQVGTGERCLPRTDAEIRAELAECDRGGGTRQVLTASGYDLDPDDEALVELEAWKAANPPTKRDIHDLIEAWHGGPETGLTLHEFLGMTWDEYKAWAERGELRDDSPYHNGKANPPTNHGPDGQRHWNNVTAMHGIVTPGRHAKMPINASIPTQRDGGK